MLNPAVKRICAARSTLILALLGGVFFLAGCDFYQTPDTSAATNVILPKVAEVPVLSGRSNSYPMVKAHLDLGGNFLLYLDTEQWMTILNKKLDIWRQVVSSTPEIAMDEQQKKRLFDAVQQFIADSGLEEISGVGLSAAPLENGLFRNRSILYHFPGKNTGFLWSILGKVKQPLKGLDYLPSTTAMAAFFDLDVATLWPYLQQVIDRAGIPGNNPWLVDFSGQFQASTGLKWTEFLDSLGGEFGLLLNVNEATRIRIALEKSVVEMPETGVGFFVKTRNDLIFKRIDQLVRENNTVIKQETNGCRLLTLKMPLPLLIPIQPTVAKFGPYLVIASSPGLVERVVAVKNGQAPGLKTTEDYFKLARGLPAEGNSFYFTSPRLGQNLEQMRQVISQIYPDLAQAVSIVYKILDLSDLPSVLSVSSVTPEGLLTAGNGARENSSGLLVFSALQPAAIAGFCSAFVVPNYFKARQAAQLNSIRDNLRLIEEAKVRWALENKKTNDTLVTKDDLLPYFKGGWVKSVLDEAYEPNPIGKRPTAKIQAALGEKAAGSVISLD